MNKIGIQQDDSIEQGIVHIEQGKLRLFASEYSKIAQQAHQDPSFESDYIAAYLAPTEFMTKPSSFESTFDTILFHLNEAYKKAISDDEREIVSRTTEDIFSRLIIITQEKINNARIQSRKGLLDKLIDTVKKMQSNFAKALTQFNFGTTKNTITTIVKKNPIALTLLTIGPEVGNLTEAFSTYLFEKWEINQNEEYFNKQLLNVFEKILNAECYKDHTLVRNCFQRVKEDTLRYAFYYKGVTACLNLSKFDFNENEEVHTNRLIVNLIIESENWALPYDYLEHINNPNVSQLISIIKWFYASCKKQVVSYTISEYGKSEALKLTQYDYDNKSINDTILTVLEVLAEQHRWEDTIDSVYTIKTNSHELYGKAKEIAVSKYKQYANKKFSDKNGNPRVKLVNESIKQFELQLTSPEKYEEYMAKYTKQQKNKSLMRTILISACILLFFTFQYYRYASYNKERLNEVKRIENVETQLTSLINQKKFNEAISVISSNLFWNEISFPFSTADEGQLLENKERYLVKIINEACLQIGTEVGTELDNLAYENIHTNYENAINSAIEILPEDKQEESTLKVSEYFAKIDNARNAYLNIVFNQINNLIQSDKKEEAIKLTSLLYHYSHKKYESAFLGLGTVTFKEYWDEKRKDLVDNL
ncbi:MAG: hypothetical protein ACWA6U_08220 [Breznakibacter sp.]